MKVKCAEQVTIQMEAGGCFGIWSTLPIATAHFCIAQVHKKSSKLTTFNQFLTNIYVSLKLKP